MNFIINEKHNKSIHTTISVMIDEHGSCLLFNIFSTNKKYDSYSYFSTLRVLYK